MFEDDASDAPQERASDPVRRAEEKAAELRMYAELNAVFEGTRKFDASIRPGLDVQVTRDIQKRLLRLERAKSPDHPILPPTVSGEAAELLDLFRTLELSTNDYHVCRRPGEVMIARWLDAGLVDAFYERMQAHFDAGLEGHKDELRDHQHWHRDDTTDQYLQALGKLDVKVADRYLRQPIRKHRLFVLSTVTADEIDILYITDSVMEIPAAELVGDASAPPEEATDQDRAWFFKLFSLRGMRDDSEQMFFFAYLQKTQDSFDID